MKLPLPRAPRLGVSRPGSGILADSDLKVPALERGLAILELLAASPEGLTLAAIKERIDISSASIFRLSTALTQLGYVQRDEKTKRFTATRKMLRLGQPQTQGRSLVECSLDAMRQVLNATGETTQLCCLTEDQCVIIEQLASTHPFKYIVDLGSRPPTYCCAPGKAMLAFLPEAEQEFIFRRIRYQRHTARTLTNRTALVKALETIRSQGYAVDHGEHFEAIHCVAAPILDHQGRAIAAITIAGPAERLPARNFAELGEILKSAAHQAAQRFLG